MDRNLSRRVEVVFPVEQPDLKKRLIQEVLTITLADNVKTRELLSDGSYRRIVAPEGEVLVRSQERFLELARQRQAEGDAPARLDIPSVVPMVDIDSAPRKVRRGRDSS